MANRKYININFPFTDSFNDETYIGLTETSKSAIRSNVLHLLLTEKGERYYLPDFGTNLKKYLFEPNDAPTNSAIIEELNNDFNKYLTNINVNFVENVSDGNSLKLSVGFIYNSDSFTFEDVINVEF